MAEVPKRYVSYLTCDLQNSACRRRDFPALQNASTSPANHCPTHPLQLLFKLGTTLKKYFVNPLPQVHERFDGHPCQVYLWHSDLQYENGIVCETLGE